MAMIEKNMNITDTTLVSAEKLFLNCFVHLNDMNKPKFVKLYLKKQCILVVDKITFLFDS